MRRPGKTLAQRKHDREARAVRRLRRAAVRYSILDEFPDVGPDLAFAFADLGAACDKLREVMGDRAAFKLAGLKPRRKDG